MRTRRAFDCDHWTDPPPYPQPARARGAPGRTRSPPRRDESGARIQAQKGVQVMKKRDGPV